MIVNDNLYPVATESENYDLTISVYDMPINEQIDDSIVYSASTSSNAPWTNYGIITGWKYNNSYLQPNENKNADGLIMPVNNTGIQRQILYGSAVNTSQVYFSEDSLYNNRNAYNITDKKESWKSIKPVRAFKYYTAIATIYIVSVRYEKPLTLWSHDLDTYFNNHSNEKMVGAYFKIYSGNEQARNINIQWYFGDYDEINLIQLGKDPSDPNKFVTTNTENVLCRLPFNISNISGILAGINQSYCATYKYNIINSFSSIGLYFNINQYDIENTTIIGTGNGDIQRLPVGSNLTKEQLLSAMATYGLLFTTSESVALNLDLTINDNILSDDLYFPVKENNGLWQGRYTHGQDNANTEQYKNKWNDDKNAPFVNGSPHIDTSDDRKFGDDNDRNMFATSQIFTHRYIVNATQLRHLSDYLNNSDKNLLNNIIQNLKLTGDNPLNSIVSIMSIPFLPVGTGSPQPIILGDNLINIGTGENKVALTSVGTLNLDTFSVNLGSADIKQEFNNFLDFSPYTQYYAYIPYCNLVELDTDVIMNKTVSFQLNCDTLSGTCECEIRVNGNLYKIVSGNFAYPVMVAGVDNAEYTSKMMSTLGKYVSGVGAMVATTAGIVTGGLGAPVAVAGLVAGAGATFSSLYEFNTTPRNFTASGTSSGGLTHILPDRVCIYRYSASDLSDVNYGHFVGYACEFSEKLSNLSGFTVCANALVECNATNTEKDKIKELLEGGVYL